MNFLTKNKLTIGLLIFCELLFGAEKSDVFKLAFLPPEESSWDLNFKQLKEELKKQSDEQIKLKIFAGQVKGDEFDMIRLMRAKDLHLACLTGIGLGSLHAPFRIYELPFFWESREEIEAVFRLSFDFYSMALAQKGFKLLAWLPPGFVNIYSKTKIENLKDLGQVQMWAWSNDILIKNFFKVFQVNPIERGLEEVYTQLKDGVINAAYAPAQIALALQWGTYTDYITRDNLVLSVGALVMHKDKWDDLIKTSMTLVKKNTEASKNQKPIHQVFLDLTQSFSQKIVDQSFLDNEKALAVLAKQGKKSVYLDPSEKPKIKKLAAQVAVDLIDQLYSRDDLIKMIEYRSLYRKTKLDQILSEKSQVLELKKAAKNKPEEEAASKKLLELEKNLEQAQKLWQESEEQGNNLKPKESSQKDEKANSKKNSVGQKGKAGKN